MPVFTPPVHADRWGKEDIGHTKRWSLWRWYEPVVEFPRTVIIRSGVAEPLFSEGLRTFSPADFTAADSGSGEEGQAVFRGKASHNITETEETILEAAGYTVTHTVGSFFDEYTQEYIL